MDLAVFLFFVGAILIGIPIAISYFLYKWIKKKEFRKEYRIFAIIPVLIVCCFICDAIYPDEEFYKEDFKEATEMEFPKNAEIIYKAASFPDQFGDYTSSSLIELDNNSIGRLEKNLDAVGFIAKNNDLITDELRYIESKAGDKKYVAQYYKQKENGKEYFVGFLDDKKSVIVTRSSW